MPNVIPIVSNAAKILMEELYENRMLERSIKSILVFVMDWRLGRARYYEWMTKT